MKNKSATIRQRGKRANAEARGSGRVDGATEMATLQLRETVAKLYTQGYSVNDICQRVSRSKPMVYAYLSQVRLEIIRQKKAHFDERMALHLDDALDTLTTHHGLLQDEDFLRSTDPERLKAIGQNLGIISDKCIVLLAAAGRSRPVPSEGQADTEAVSG